ncbi:MAG: putative metalloprotease CJM1_0395 family protein [Rhodospirillaceae bacterium]|nr:putative metalloprotease CJM1_0395 family protein [Rhodospirillaceae bacterium]
MLLLQVNTAFQFTGGAGAAEALTRSTAIPSGSRSLQDPQRPNVAPGNAVQPGPPVNRLDFRTQNQAQSSVEDDEADGEGVATEGAEIQSTQRTNENGEPVNQEGLTEAEQREVERLKARDREVRAHERAHATVGGGIAGQPRYTFTTGPDGRQYAVGGEVSIDTSPVPGNPEATIRKMEQVKRAALAPTQPSSQDRRVAADAEAKIQAAR